MTALAAASLGATVGGQVMQSQEATANQARAIESKNAATARTIAAEDALQKRSSGIFDTAIKPYEGAVPQQNLQAAQSKDASAILANAPTGQSLANGATTTNAPKVVQDSENASIASRVKKLQDQGTALGNLTGYDTQGSDANRSLTDSRLQLGTVGDFARQTANVGNAQMQADVTNSQQPLSPFGDVLSGAGQVGLTYAGKNGAFGKTKTPATPSYFSL